MAILFSDSYDHYTTPSAKYDVVTTGGNGAVSIDASKGRNGTSGLWLNGGSTNNSRAVVQRNTPTLSEVWMGFALYVPSKAGVLSDTTIVAFRDGSTTQVALLMTTDGHLKFAINLTSTYESGSDLVTSTYALSFGVQYYIEVHVKIANAGGDATLRVDGVQWATYTGDTQATANASFGNFTLVAWPRTSFNQFSFDRYIDDVYLVDSTGTVNTGFLGNVRVQALFPNAVGNSSQWVVTPSGANYTAVDESAPNDDTDYVESATVNDKDTYGLGNITPTLIDGRAVVIWARAKKTDAGTRTIHTVARSGSSESESVDLNADTSYVYLAGVHEQDPSTSAKWTASGINAAEIGVKVIA